MRRRSKRNRKAYPAASLSSTPPTALPPVDTVEARAERARALRGVIADIADAEKRPPPTSVREAIDRLTPAPDLSKGPVPGDGTDKSNGP